MIITDDDAALAYLQQLCESATCPTLSEGELTAILDANKLAELWQASKVYELGSIVIPTLRNRTGSRYRLIQYTDSGTDQKSGTSEPAWPASRSATVEDNHVTWQEDGDDYGAVLWDFTAAARDAWLKKAAKASPTSDVGAPLEIKSSQLFDHCMKMADRYQPVFVL